MNICYISREHLGSKRAGGIATYIHEASLLMKRFNHNVFVICASDNVNQNHFREIEGVNYIYISGADFYIHSNRILQLILTKVRSVLFFNSYRKNIVKEINKLNSKCNLDIVEFPEFGNEAKYWLRLKSRDIKTIVRFHGPSGYKYKEAKKEDNYYFFKELETSMLADGISFCSEAMRQTLLNEDFSKDMLCNFANSQIVIHNPIILKHRLLKIYNVDKYIFTAGSFVESKGFKELISAVKIINENSFKINLIIAGKLGKLGVEYLNKAKQDSMHWLKILGPIERNSLYDYYKNAELCCFPSHWESFGLTCVEAMSVGGLVLGSSSGGMSEIITDGMDGFLIQPKDVTLLNERILTILSLDEKEKILLRANAKNKVKENFSENIISCKMSAFYSELI